MLPRLVVVDGPDVGAEFPITSAGGGIGRGEGNAVQLSDLAVSRTHCSLESRSGRLVLLDAGSRNRTLVNGKPISEHVLLEGDEITVGKTRLAYLPPEGGVAVVPTAAGARVTLEFSTGELLRTGFRRKTAGETPARADTSSPGARSGQHLAALARLGDGLRRAADKAGISRTACETLREALEADRVFLLMQSGGRYAPVAAAIASDDQAGGQLSLSREVLDKVVKDGKAILLGATGDLSRPAIAVPMTPFEEGREVPGLFFADRRAQSRSPAPAWDEVDVQLVACASHLSAAALDGVAARELLMRENRALEERLGGSPELIGQSRVAQAVLSFVAKVGPTDSTVLLLGESGAGKEMVASAIHRQSRRTRGPFVCVNCAALTETLLESELFGHEKGAFTGATEKKLGRFELADGGTLFLDEIGELSPKCQTKFLRVLEERRFDRVGGSRPIATDVRVIAATNRNLTEMVRCGEFREDLYYRLSVIQTEVPALRERADDIPLLSQHFLSRLRAQTGRRVTDFAPEAMRALCAYHWPGNVRELKNAIERALVLGETALIRLEDLPPRVIDAAPRALAPPTAPSAHVPPAFFPSSTHATLADAPPGLPPYVIPTPVGHGAPRSPGARSLRELEKDGILAALTATRGNKAQAAAILEIDRSTLYKKLKEYGIDG
jgi:DNA-binding NtrC family response regulator